MEDKFKQLCKDVQNKMDFDNWCSEYEGLEYPYPYIHVDIEPQLYYKVMEFIETEDWKYSLPIHWGASFGCDCGCSGNLYDSDEWDEFFRIDKECDEKLEKLEKEILEIMLTNAQ